MTGFLLSVGLIVLMATAPVRTWPCRSPSSHGSAIGDSPVYTSLVPALLLGSFGGGAALSRSFLCPELKFRLYIDPHSASGTDVWSPGARGPRARAWSLEPGLQSRGPITSGIQMRAGALLRGRAGREATCENSSLVRPARASVACMSAAAGEVRGVCGEDPGAPKQPCIHGGSRVRTWNRLSRPPRERALGRARSRTRKLAGWLLNSTQSTSCSSIPRRVL